MFTKALINWIIAYCKEVYDYEISSDTAEQYLHSLADLYGVVVSMVHHENELNEEKH